MDLLFTFLAALVIGYFIGLRHKSGDERLAPNPNNLRPGDLVRLKCSKHAPVMALGIRVGDAYYCTWYESLAGENKTDLLYLSQLEKVVRDTPAE